MCGEAAAAAPPILQPSNPPRAEVVLVLPRVWIASHALAQRSSFTNFSIPSNQQQSPVLSTLSPPFSLSGFVHGWHQERLRSCPVILSPPALTMDGLKVRTPRLCFSAQRLTHGDNQDAVNQIVKDPDLAPLLAVVKAARNGAVYGAKVRFPHALV